MIDDGRPSGASRLGAALRRALAARRWPLALAAVGCVLAAPSIASGFATEDWLFRFSATQPFELRHLNLYDAQDLEDGVDVARQFGSLPWVTPDDFHISFWRPLTSLSYHLDFRVWAFTPAWPTCRACSGTWAWCWRRQRCSVAGSGTTWVAGLAGLLFAIDDAHAPPSGGSPIGTC